MPISRLVRRPPLVMPTPAGCVRLVGGGGSCPRPVPGLFKIWQAVKVGVCVCVCGGGVCSFHALLAGWG